MNELGPGPSTSRMRTTASPRHFVFAFVAFVFIHFFATWLLTGLSWNHDWAESVADVLWRPCAQLVSALPAGKPWSCSRCFAAAWFGEASPFWCWFWLGAFCGLDGR